MNDEDGPPPLKMFPLHRPRRSPIVRAKADDHCQHRHPIIDERLRQVGCGDCGAILDPIALLVEWAQYERKLDDRVKLIEHYEGRRAEEQRRERERQATNPRRSRCRTCRKLFVQVPDAGSGGSYSHWGVCNPCHEIRVAAGPIAAS